MDFAGIVDIALPVIYVLVGAVLVWFVVELALTIRSTRSTIDDAHKELTPTLKNVEKITAQVDPLIAHVDALVTDQIDPLLTRVNEIAEEAKPAVGRVDPLVERLSLTVDAANLELMRVDQILEDVTQIILNIKKLALKMNTDEDKNIEIDVNGPAKVTAADIVADPDVEVLNPEQYICTVADGGHFHVRMTVKKGRGYVAADQNKSDDMPIGVLPIDSIFTPISRVNYQVESTRVGRRNDFDKLTLDVWTNGSISPREAISLAAKILTEHLDIFVNLTDEAKNAEIMVEKEETHKEKMLEMTI